MLWEEDTQRLKLRVWCWVFTYTAHRDSFIDVHKVTWGGHRKGVCLSPTASWVASSTKFTHHKEEREGGGARKKAYQRYTLWYQRNRASKPVP
jgi:hypothetical protein